jgi:mono/diheme cytochrome c family protein
VSAKFFVLTMSSVAVVFVSFVAAQGPATVWDGVYTAEQAKRGAALYKTHCAACHGEALQGAEAAPALVGDTFNGTWEGVTLGELFDRARTTMPQNAPGSLSRTQHADILAFILQTGKFPAGDKPFDAATHGGVQYRTYKP